MAHDKRASFSITCAPHPCAARPRARRHPTKCATLPVTDKIGPEIPNRSGEISRRRVNSRSSRLPPPLRSMQSPRTPREIGEIGAPIEADWKPRKRTPSRSASTPCTSSYTRIAPVLVLCSPSDSEQVSSMLVLPTASTAPAGVEEDAPPAPCSAPEGFYILNDPPSAEQLAFSKAASPADVRRACGQVESEQGSCQGAAFFLSPPGLWPTPVFLTCSFLNGGSAL